METLGSEHMIANGLDQRRQARRGGADPVGERGDAEIEPLTGVDLALSVQRQVCPVFAEQDLRQELRSGAAASDRMERRQSFSMLAGDRPKSRPISLDTSFLVGFRPSAI